MRIVRAVCVLFVAVITYAMTFGALVIAYGWVGVIFTWHPPFLLVHAGAAGLAAASAVWSWGRTGRWSKRRSVGACIGLGLAVACCPVPMAIFVYQYVQAFRWHDSDSECVPTELINGGLWPGIEMPSSAHDVHVLIGGALSNVMYLRFTATKEDAARFVTRVLSTAFEGNARELGGDPAIRGISIEKDWWQPRPDVPWFFERGRKGSCFVQLDEGTNVVYLRVSDH